MSPPAETPAAAPDRDAKYRAALLEELDRAQRARRRLHSRLYRTRRQRDLWRLRYLEEARARRRAESALLELVRSGR